MKITKDAVANKISAYLHHNLSLEELVDWAENAMMQAEFEARNLTVIREVVSQLGLADVRTFGLTWEDCEEMLGKLGYTTRIKVMAA
jgi:hypothetical protein